MMMYNSNFCFLCISLLVCGSTSKHDNEQQKDEFCKRDNLSECDETHSNMDQNGKTVYSAMGSGPTGSEGRSKSKRERKLISRLDGHHVGHTTDVLLDSGNILHMKTLSLSPLIFEVRDFLSAVECEHLMSLAQDTGLQDSVTVRDDHIDSQSIKILDLNHDEKIDINEMMLTIENAADLYLTETDILDMYSAFDLDQNGDGLISPEELQKIQASEMFSYLEKLSQSNPIKRSRYSKQVWIHPESSKDQIFVGIQDRVQQVTKLPEIMITKSNFQVVHYGAGGHYNAHQDSSVINPTLPCCVKTIKHLCRLCRYMTILFYLNDVPAGGSTAFPVADNATYDEQVLRINHKINLQEHCDSANLVVGAERGKAVIWYNHHLDTSTGWVGDQDRMSWHGGCPVKRGEKWIANFWILFTDDPDDYFGDI